MRKNKITKKIKIGLATLTICFFSKYAYAIAPANDTFRYPFYAGLTGGYGSTTWGKLVPPTPNDAMSMSTPIGATEGGFAWGAFGGYEFLPQFALEASYMHYADATLYFDSMSLFSDNNDQETELTSKIDSISLMGKIMLVIPRTTVRIYSGVGPAAVHRNDKVKNVWHVNPSFSAGINYNLTPHWMAELGTNYIAGYGKAEIDPSKNFVPFLYSVFLRLAYRF